MKIAVAVTSIIAAMGAATGADLAKPPVAARQPWSEMRHGEAVADDYRWLQKKDSPEVQAYLKAENAYTQAMTSDIQPMADAIYKEVRARMKEVDLTVPTRRGQYYYYARNEAGKQYAINARRKADGKGNYDENAQEEVLLDQNVLAEGKPFLSVANMEVSPDGTLLAYTTDTTGFRQYELHIKDLRTGQLLKDSAPRLTSFAWAADNKTYFYTQEDATTKRSDRLFRSSLGGEPIQLMHETVEQFGLHVSDTRDQQYIVAIASATDTTEVSILPSHAPGGQFHSVLGRTQGHRYYVEHRAGELFIRTNKDAKNFRVVRAPVAKPDAWTEVVPHKPDVLLRSLELFKDYMVVGEKARALNGVRIYDFAKKHWNSVKFDDAVYVVRGAGTPEFASNRYRINYQSPVSPQAIMDVDMASGALTLLKQQEVVGGFDPTRFEVKRLWATARDGEKVPLWMVHKKGIKQDGTAPLLLYAYGSYGISMEPGFSLARISLLERGAIYAVAHIRGGTEMGERWHEDGMLMKKMNTFTDFIDCAEYLVKEKWTRPERLGIQGGSAGGLLMGAVTNMRADLFRAVHAAVPFVDVMNTMMDASLPLTTGEYLEWGNPNEKPAYDYMRSYSPYDNIAKKAYPAMLVTTSLNDSQVMYWEPAKYVAKLRAFKTDSNPLLLKINMGAGHGGASGRYDAVKENAFEMAWMLSQLNIKE